MEGKKRKYSYDKSDWKYWLGTITFIVFAILALPGLILLFASPLPGIMILIFAGIGIFIGITIRNLTRTESTEKFISKTQSIRVTNGKEIHLPEIIEGLQTGKIQISSGQEQEFGLLLQTNEKIITVVPDVNLMEYLRTETMWGRDGSWSLRVQPGVVTKTAATAKSGFEQQVMDTGKLVITSDRLVFDGIRTTSETNWQDVISIEPGVNGISVKSRKTETDKYYILAAPEKYNVNIEHNGRIFKEIINGELLAAIIRGAIKRKIAS